MFDVDLTFEFLKKVVGVMGNIMGDKCEVVLHDLRSPESSIIAIVHGDITGRKVGDPSTNLGLPVLKNPYGDYDNYNYKSRTRSGKVLRCSSVYLKDPDGRVFAAICANYDISELSVAANILRSLTLTQDEEVDEHFATDINDVINRILDEALQTNRNAILSGDKEERVKLIQALDAKGIFTVKGAVDRVAKLLGVSRVTVYGYLNEVEAMKLDNFIP